MTRYVAFLRGINVGGHTVKMDALKGAFEALGFEKVSTFIASGNVIFETDSNNRAPAQRERRALGGRAGKADALEKKIEGALKKALGYEVATFLRTDKQVAEIAAYDAFPKEKPKDGDTQYVTFLRAEQDAATTKKVLALSNEGDVLHLHDAELHWLRRGSLLDSTISTKQFEQAFGKQPTTVRNLNTIKRLAAKLEKG